MAIILLSYGLLLFMLAILPYLLVGQPINENGWATKNEMVIHLPACMILCGISSLLITDILILKNVLLFCCFIVFSSMLYSQTVHVKNKYGEALVYVDGNNLRLKNQYGDALFYIDGQTIKRKNQYGEAVYFIDGQTIRSKNQYGEAIYFWDGQTLRSKNQYGDALYFVDGNTVKYKNQYGDPMYFFDGFVEKWVVVCLIR